MNYAQKESYTLYRVNSVENELLENSTYSEWIMCREWIYVDNEFYVEIEFYIENELCIKWLMNSAYN